MASASDRNTSVVFVKMDVLIERKQQGKQSSAGKRTIKTTPKQKKDRQSLVRGNYSIRPLFW
jgi:hypothetical protein